jgi:hypothetical protein
MNPLKFGCDQGGVIPGRALVCGETFLLMLDMFSAISSRMKVITGDKL